MVRVGHLAVRRPQRHLLHVQRLLVHVARVLQVAVRLQQRRNARQRARNVGVQRALPQQLVFDGEGCQR